MIQTDEGKIACLSRSISFSKGASVSLDDFCVEKNRFRGMKSTIKIFGDDMRFVATRRTGPGLKPNRRSRCYEPQPHEVNNEEQTMNSDRGSVASPSGPTATRSLSTLVVGMALAIGGYGMAAETASKLEVKKQVDGKTARRQAG